MSRAFLIIAVAAVLIFAAAAVAEEIISGPIEAQVFSVYDGDTIKAEVRPWPRHIIRVSIRINGIDTPEIRGKCESERAAAYAARAALLDIIEHAKNRIVLLRNVHEGKYAGRVIADVFTPDGKNVAETMIALGHARPYHGGKREGWCG